MVRATTSQMTLEQFLTSSFSGDRYELIDGEAIPKVAPKRLHAGVQKALIHVLDDWTLSRGHFYPEWAVTLKRKERDWVPVPDLTYVSFQRLSRDWDDDGACPIPPDLAIEIISPGQTFGELAEKATDYIEAGVLRVWLIDPQAQSITVFTPNLVPQTYRGDRPIQDPLLEGLDISAQRIFVKAGQAK